MRLCSLRGSTGKTMGRTIKSWEYLYGGLMFFIGGWMAIIGTVWSASTEVGDSVWFLGLPLGGLILAVGVYYLWKFDRVYESEKRARLALPAPK